MAASTSATRSPWRCGSSGPRPRHGRPIAGRFRYILVDEFQDTNRAQAELVALLAEPHRNVTVVGDDDQAIYAFRGAAVDNILAFRERYAAARTVVLRRNYRSLAPVLETAYRLIRFNDPDRLEVRAGVSKRLRPERSAPAPAPVRLEVFASGSEEADWIAAEIGRRIAGGAAPRDHAVLVRANGHADPILRALNMAGIPWRFSGASGLYARPEVKMLLAFLRVVADPESSLDVYALAASDVVRAWWRGPHRDRQHGATAQPLGVGDPRRAGAAARHPARSHRRRGPPRTDSSPTSARTPIWPTSVRPARSCTGSCAAAGCWPGSFRRTVPWPKRRSRTSRASSRSSVPSPRCSRTIAPSTSPATWRR